MEGLDIRLRVASPGVLSLPWTEPLADWDATEVPIRDFPVGPSRHLVKFVETDGQLWALKELPQRVAHQEYAVLRELEVRELPSVRAVGLVLQPDHDNAILVTRYLERSWQYRRLLMRLPPDPPKHRERLHDAMAGLLVDLHRNGVFWGDCSLANTLFSRDGQVLQAWLVDAETSEIHPQLSDGQRAHDISILVENVAAGMVDLAVRLEQPEETHDVLIDEARGIADRYEALWDTLHAEPVFSYADRYQIEGQIRRVQDLGFAVDEVLLQGTDEGPDRLRLKVAVAGRHFHATQLRDLTGLSVSEGQALILLNDLRAYQGELQRSAGALPDVVVGHKWAEEVLRPGRERAWPAVGKVGDATQAYCDLLEVRWLLSEQAGRDVGDDVALAALAANAVPPDSAALMSVAEAPTGSLRIPQPDRLEEAEDGPATYGIPW